MYVHSDKLIPTAAADYDADYVTNPADATRTVVNSTTNELVMQSNVATVIATFKIIIDNIAEGPEEYFLFLEGTRRVLILTPMVTVTILDE